MTADPRRHLPGAFSTRRSEDHEAHVSALAGRGFRLARVRGPLSNGGGEVDGTRSVVGSVDAVEAMECGNLRLHLLGISRPGAFSILASQIELLETAASYYIANRSFPEWVTTK